MPGGRFLDHCSWEDSTPLGAGPQERSNNVAVTQTGRHALHKTLGQQRPPLSPTSCWRWGGPLILTYSSSCHQAGPQLTRPALNSATLVCLTAFRGPARSLGEPREASARRPPPIPEVLTILFLTAILSELPKTFVSAKASRQGRQSD